MAIQTIDIGSAPNDGTGDTVRDAFDKVNDNFAELYSNAVVNTSITVGNTTANSSANLTVIRVGNSTVNTTISTGAAGPFIYTTNSISSANLYTQGLKSGNSTVNGNFLSTALNISNTTGVANLTPIRFDIGNSTVNTTISIGSIHIGNSTVNTTVNSSFLTVKTANVSSNTFYLGASTDAANGYTYLPNGLKLNWGYVDANSTAGDITFASAYTTNVYSVTVTSNSTTLAYRYGVISQNNTGASIRTSNTGSARMYWQAIGS